MNILSLPYGAAGERRPLYHNLLLLYLVVLLSMQTALDLILFWVTLFFLVAKSKMIYIFMNCNYILFTW